MTRAVVANDGAEREPVRFTALEGLEDGERPVDEVGRRSEQIDLDPVAGQVGQGEQGFERRDGPPRR